MSKRFWRTTALKDMTPAQWESLCDGCGLCCLVKLEDEDDGSLHYTRIACRLLDCESCRCGNYPLRATLVQGCVVLTPEKLPEVAPWLPPSCAYRRLHEGKGLAHWHPLVSGDADGPRKAGFSVSGWAIPEYDVDEEDWPDHVLEGPPPPGKGKA